MIEILKTQWGDKRIDTVEGRTNELKDTSAAVAAAAAKSLQSCPGGLPSMGLHRVGHD